jgi:signal transduction histidine kinase
MLRGSLVTLVATGTSLGIALALAPAVNDAPVPLFLAGVVISAWLGGLWPGLATTGLSTLALVSFFDLSRASPLPGPEDTALDLALFVAVASLISWLTANVKSTNRRLDAARGQAEAAARAREELLAAAAHDLKSPLTEISMIAQLARRRLEHADTDPSPATSVARQLATIEASARSMAGLVDELLDAARLQAGRGLSLNRQPTHLLTLVEAAVLAYQRRTDFHQIRMVPRADPVGTWDAARMARVLDNLLSNAIKYSPEGGEIVVEVAEEDRRSGSRMATVRVCDRGLGIPAAEMEHVFERFFRAANVGAIGGTGIGLAGSRQIVEQHGGTLTAESREGVGSTFTLHLPIGTANEPAKLEALEHGLTAGSKVGPS